MEYELTEKTIDNLKKNGFTVYHDANIKETEECFWKKVVPSINPKSISYGVSMTLEATGILNSIQENGELRMVGPFLEK